jgi:septal ring factor EnvC (AmiA/AmiB activator)
MNVFNIGVAFLTLSLSSQLVSAKQNCKKAEAAKEQLETKVETLEQLVLSLGGSLPDPEADAAAAARAEEEERAAIQRQRDQEAKALASGDDKKGTKAKLI